jgi:hypothetical protein
MSITNTLKTLNLEPDSLVTLTYSEGTDVFVHNETEVETALAETDVVSTFSELIATPGLNVTTAYGGNVLQSLRSDGHLDDYDRDGDFGSYLSEVISDNFYDLDLIEHSTEKYDHKRGFCTLTAEVQIPVAQIISETPFLTGWRASVPTKDGTLMFDA